MRCTNAETHCPHYIVDGAAGTCCWCGKNAPVGGYISRADALDLILSIMTPPEEEEHDRTRGS